MQIELNWRTLSYKYAICLECVHDTFWPANTGDLSLNYQLIIYGFPYTVKPVYNDHPWDSKIVAVADRWSLFKDHFSNKYSNLDFKMVVVVDRWSLFRGGRWLRIDCIPIQTTNNQGYNLWETIIISSRASLETYNL